MKNIRPAKITILRVYAFFAKTQQHLAGFLHVSQHSTCASVFIANQAVEYVAIKVSMIFGIVQFVLEGEKTTPLLSPSFKHTRHCHIVHLSRYTLCVFTHFVHTHLFCEFVHR